MSEGAYLGRVFGNWEVLHLLGEGAFGSVFEARHRTIAGRRAAIKVLRPEMSLRPEMRRRFLNEASAASRADHENIVQIFDCGDTPDGLCYVIMELLRGARLQDLLQAGPLPPARVVHLATQIAGALAAAHRVGVIHRDLKPENILIVPRDTNPEFVKVLDFGIAKLWDSDTQTRTGMWMGTPPYMSPEQWQTLPDIDGRSDIYALGIILFQCLTGTLPLHGNNPYEWLTAHLNHPVPDPRSHAPVPASLAELVLQMLAKPREARPQDMREVLSRLQRALSERSAPVLPTPPPAQPPQVEVSPPLAPPPSPPSTLRSASGEMDVVPRRRRPRAALLGGGAAALVLAGAAGFFGLKAGGRGDPPPQQRPISQPAAPPPVKAPPERPKRTPVALPPELVPLGGFAIGKYEVSQGEFRAFAEATKLRGPLPWEGIEDFAAIRDLPVNQVPKNAAAGYCRWRYGKLGGRLPTETEWARAARGAQGRRFPWAGMSLGKDRANLGGRPPVLLPVAALPAGDSPEGVRQLIGNVAEWTADAAPSGMAVARGGGANTPAKEAGATARRLLRPDALDPFVGFRCAVSLPEDP